nr:uncharacterized protein LOC109233316 isoform X2 [Ipomoea batatas]
MICMLAAITLTLTSKPLLYHQLRCTQTLLQTLISSLRVLPKASNLCPTLQNTLLLL